MKLSSAPAASSPLDDFDTRPAMPSEPAVERSVVIPVFNGSATVGFVVEGLLAFDPAGVSEVVLVNDGSDDDSERACRELAARYPGRVTFVQLSRNFGEHAAVTAGFRHCRGRRVAIVDDDGQHPPEEVLRLFQAAEAGGYDVVYGRLVGRRHPFYRRCLSRLHNLVSCRMLGKPPGLYLSSFKVVSRFIADQIAAYDGPFPYVDGVILNATRNFTQIDVLHRSRLAGRSGYTLSKLLRLWWLVFLGWSTTSFRIALVVGSAAASCALVLGLLFGLRGANEGLVPVWRIPVGLALLGGLTLLQLGLLGEYLRGLAATKAGSRPFLIKYVHHETAKHA